MTGVFDLAVVGGGVNGAGIARDAAGRGAKVLLLEGGDLACGTSSASTKLIHGGLRYLEHYEFALVREALAEREALWRIAPHIIRPLRLVLPCIEGLRPAWLLRLGLFLYDHIGGRELLAPARSIRFDSHPAGAPLKPDVRKGFEYSDCRVDDARLVVLNAMDAARHGAKVRTRTPLTGARRDGDGWLLETPGGVLRVRALVNAAGPSVLDLLAIAGERPRYGLRLVRGSHIVLRKLFDHDFAYFFQLPDRRMLFAIPYLRDFTLVGTTDADHTGPLDAISASEAEIAYLCKAISRHFRQAVAPADVVWSYAGVRALVDDGSGKPEAATRGYRLDMSSRQEGAPLLSVYGGKITTYRRLSEDAVTMLSRRLPALAGKPWTKTRPLPGGDFPVDGLAALEEELAARYPFLGRETVLRIAGAYGTCASAWLGKATSAADLGRDFGAGLSEAEVDYLRREEWAVTADDILWRRTKLGLHLDGTQLQALREYLGD